MKLKNNSFIHKFKNKVGTQRFIAFIVMVFIYVFFAIASPAFRSLNTLISIFDSSYYIGFMAIGVTFVVITGGIDLSIGTILICSTLIGGTLYGAGVPMWLTLILIVITGGIFGFVNGCLISRLKLPAFIATLGMMMITRGLGSIITKTKSITFPLRSSDDGWYKSLFRTGPMGELTTGLPTGFLILIGLAVVMAIILNKTKVGRYILAIGSNKEAARLSGVNVMKYETIAYVISGIFAGIAGISYVAIYSTVQPGTGNGFEMDAIAGVVIGGTSLAGGMGSIAGTMLGVFIMSILKVGLPFIGLQPHYQLFITGFVLIIAVYADVKNRVKSRK